MFAHAVNTRAGVAAALATPGINFLEADVVMAAGGPTMGHDPGKDGGYPFDAWLRDVVGSGVGIKVDVKEWDAVPGVLAALARVLAGEPPSSHTAGGAPAVAIKIPYLRLRSGAAWFDRPAIMINADVLAAAPGALLAQCTFNPRRAVLSRDGQVAAARTFVDQVWAAVPGAIASVGWTTLATPGAGYSAAAVDDMVAVIDDAAAMGAAVTFPLRAQFVRASWPALSPLLQRYPLTSFTLWAHTPPAADDLTWMRTTLPPTRCMYDLPPPPPPTDTAAAAANDDEGDAAAVLRERTIILASAAAFLAFSFALHHHSR